jgi:probable HAF family extracellular repeat protein
MKVSMLRAKSFCIVHLGLALAVCAGTGWTQEQKSKPARYTVTDLGTLDGGTYSEPYSITQIGLISGTASPPDGTQHAVLWFRGLNFDISIPGLGGPNSISFSTNDSIQAIGEAETSTSDPNSEDFCGFKALGLPSSGTCLPFLWQDGVMSPLATLGGHNGAANMINSQGEVVGLAETAIKDPKCPAPQVLQFEPVIWEKGKVQKLPTIHDDPDGAAFGVNDTGQVVGASGDCIAFNTNLLVNLQPLHALLWQKDTVTDLGTLGGTGHGMGILAFNLNNKGQVVGFSDTKDDKYFHAFLWNKETGMKDLGTLAGDVRSVAIGINDRGDVTGLSLDMDFNPTAFLWHNGVLTDLNTLIPAKSPLFLMQACSINSRGEIVGLAVQTSTGDLHAYLATPSTGGSESAAPAEQGVGGESPKVAVPENVRGQMRAGRFGARFMGPQ